jgi:hypothetical protein
MNPASFSNVDSMTFMLDMGITGQMGWFEEGPNKDKKMNGNLEYIALQFPLLRKMGISAGLEPISYVGYRYGELLDNNTALSLYEGTGGLSQVYGALSYDFLDRFSVGVKFAYLFGNLSREKRVEIAGGNPSLWRDTISANGLTYELGLQYHQEIGKHQTLVIGAVYSPKIRPNVKTSYMEILGNRILEYSSSRDSVFELPESYGLGFSYTKLNKLTLGADVSYQKWGSAKYYDKSDTLSNRLKFNLGGEIIPNLMSNRYFNRVRYRAGLSFAKSYIVAENLDLQSGYKEYGVNVGFGFPMTDRRSFINMAFEYSLLSPNINTFVKEQYFKLTFSYTFNELWFFKRRVQ